MTRELTEAEIERQDSVDFAIYNLVASLVPTPENVDWDIEWIAEIRDTIQEMIVNKLGLMTEQEFYPYIELTTDGRKLP